MRTTEFAALEGHPLEAELRFDRRIETRSIEIVERLERFAIAVSFGSVDSTASVPCRMSHASVPEALRHVAMPPRDLVRLSIGLEDPEDLIADLDRALESSSRRGEVATDPRRQPEQCGASR